MRITAITRYKHGELYATLQKAGWTQSELSRRAGLSVTQVADIINLVRRPNEEQANAIQKALGSAGAYLDVLAEWPETFAGLKRGYRREQTKEVPTERLIDHPEVFQISATGSDGEYVNQEMEDCLNALVSELPPRQQIAIRDRFWNGKTLKQTGKNLKIQAKGARQIELRALRAMRRPSNLKKLLACKDGDC